MSSGKITVNGALYKVTDKGAYSHDIGGNWKMVQTPDGEKMAVGSAGRWRFWTPADRTRPLREAIARGWPNKNPSEYVPSRDEERSDTAVHLEQPLPDTNNKSQDRK